MDKRSVVVSKELEQVNCSILLDEVKKKVQLLRENGVSETDIASLLYIEKPLIKLTVGKDYRIFLATIGKKCEWSL